MAGARIERMGSIFKRVEGLYKGKALKQEDLPLWYDIYQAFPPHVEPSLSRAITSASSVKNLVFTDDFIKRDFYQHFKFTGPAMNFINSSLKPARHHLDMYVNTFKSMALQHRELKAAELRSKVVSRLADDGIMLEPRQQ